MWSNWGRTQLIPMSTNFWSEERFSVMSEAAALPGSTPSRPKRLSAQPMQTMSDTPHDSLSLRTPSSLAAAERTQHICVCICTYKRPGPLQRLLKGLEGQETQGLFSFSVVVADNDA